MTKADYNPGVEVYETARWAAIGRADGERAAALGRAYDGSAIMFEHVTETERAAYSAGFDAALCQGGCCG